jgi:hypothetical protein
MSEKKNPLHDVIKNAEIRYDGNANSPPGLKAALALTLQERADKMLALQKEVTDLAQFLSGPATPLELCVHCKKLEKAAEAVTELVRGDANRQFQNALALNPASKTVSIAGAVLKTYSGRPSWVYPAHILALEERLNKEKKIAETDGTAVKADKLRDIEKDSFFSITV